MVHRAKPRKSVKRAPKSNACESIEATCTNVTASTIDLSIEHIKNYVT